MSVNIIEYEELFKFNISARYWFKNYCNSQVIIFKNLSFLKAYFLRRNNLKDDYNLGNFLKNSKFNIKV